MTKEELKGKILELFPAMAMDEASQWLSVSIVPEESYKILESLRNNLHFDYLFCLSGVDWKTHLSVVYHLTNSSDRATNLVVKLNIQNRENPVVDSVHTLWRTADFHELEIYDLFGIKFKNHPGLRRLFLTDDWKGWPMRKDYSDPVNIIDL